MAKIDVVKTAFAGFGVIGRNPLAVLVWGVLLLVVGVLPFAGMMGGFMSTVMELATLQESGVEPTPEQIMPMMSAMMAFYPIMFLSSIALRAILGGGVFRAVLEPENRAWFHLRLGVQELWLALLTAVFLVLGMVAYFFVWILIIPAMVIGYMVAPQDPGVAVLIILPFALAACAVLVWLALRFSLAFPMTFAERKFRLFESWTLTRGHTGSLFLVALLLVAMVLGFELVISIIAIVAIGAGAAAGGFDEAAVEAFFRQDPAMMMSQLAPWLIGGGLLFCIVGAALMTIFMAPWAEAYRQLRDQTTPAEPAIAA